MPSPTRACRSREYADSLIFPAVENSGGVTKQEAAGECTQTYTTANALACMVLQELYAGKEQEGEGEEGGVAH